MPTGVYYDLPAAATTAQPTGAKVFGYDPDVQAKFFTQEFHINAADFAPLEWNTVVAIAGTNYYLVDETTPTDAGAGMLQWTRTYYQKPPDRSEFESIVYNYTVVYLRDIDTGLWIGFPQGASFPLQASTRVDYKYYTTDDPATDIPINKGWKIFKIENAICTQGTNPVSGTPPDLAITSPYLGDDSEVTRWKGNIWVRKQRYVPYPEVNVEVLV
jgi:hypothetical protein